jgi:crotonobetaine/carnitine-CoA ligase
LSIVLAQQPRNSIMGRNNPVLAKLPPWTECVIPSMLDDRCRTLKSKPLIAFDDGSQWTYGETQQMALETAAALQGLDIKRGEPVLVWLPTGVEILRLHLGLCYMGGIFVPINTALKGSTLEHVIRSSGARIMICHAQLTDRLTTINIGALERLVVVGSGGSAPGGLRTLSQAALNGKSSEFREPSPAIGPWETNGIFYTSGTTGPSKGVVCPHFHTIVLGRSALRFLTPDDRFLSPLPYFHLGGAAITIAVIAMGATMVLLREYRTETFWDDVRRTRSTSTLTLGSISTFLWKAPPKSNDRDHPLRKVLQQPLVPEWLGFAQRFGVDIYTGFDMSEMPTVISDGPLPLEAAPPNYCGRKTEMLPDFELRLVDGHDQEVPDETTGELVVRCALPWVITPGYHGMPEATAAAWRNGWFHTGDLMRRDTNGGYFYMGRLKDAIRRRGENISASELEAEVLRHSSIANVAAIGVPSSHGGDDVMVVIEPKPDAQITPKDLIEFLIPRLPHFMVPRYVRVVKKLPYTETQKIEKTLLRTQGTNCEGIWDREAEGIAVKRDRLG